MIVVDRQKSQALADFSMFLCSRIESIEEWVEINYYACKQAIKTKKSKL
jgi:hypothetical protein